MRHATVPGEAAELRLAGLLLAAGESRRLGRPKQLVPVDGVPLVRRQTELLAGLVDPLVVITGAYADEVGHALRGVDCELAHNPRWIEGMGSSLAVGVAQVGPKPAGLLILLCDQYRLDRTTLVRLISAWRRTPGVAAACRWAGGNGAPAVFPASMLPALRNLHGDRGAKDLLARHPETCFIEAPQAAFDLDTPQDLERLLQSPSR